MKSIPRRKLNRRSPSRLDPTRLATLRRQFRSDLIKRLTKLRQAIVQLILREDALGLNPRPLLVFRGFNAKKHNRDKLAINAEGRWQFHSTEQKLTAFREWLKRLLRQQFIDETVSEQDQWFRRYIEEGFRKGAARAFDDTRPQVKEWQKSPEARERLNFYAGTRAEFLNSAFNNPASLEKVKLLASRAFNDLKGISDAMSTKITRALTDGLVQGQNSKTIAREMVKQVQINRSRANAIAQTELTRAHAEGQLQAFESLGVTQLGVMAEWSTAEDDRVCEACSALDDVVMTVEEAKGLLPRHPNCRCSWVPANVGENEDEQVRGKRGVERAIDDSYRAELPKTIDRSLEEQKERSSWAGADKDIAKERPMGIFNAELRIKLKTLANNAFCPTGEGGGQNPHCSPDGIGGGKSSKGGKRFKDPTGFNPQREKTPSVGYHTTDLENLEAIAKSGLKPQVSTTGGGDAGKVKGIYFFDQIQGRRFDIPVLRVQTGHVNGVLDDTEVREYYEYAGNPNKHIGKESAFIVGEKIPPHLIEVRSKQGWIPIKEYVKSAEYIKEKSTPIQGLKTITKSLQIGGKTIEVRQSGTKLSQVFHRGKFIGGVVDSELKNENYMKMWIASKLTKNAFCPTGEGGGQDNSCSPSGENSKPDQGYLPRQQEGFSKSENKLLADFESVWTYQTDLEGNEVNDEPYTRAIYDLIEGREDLLPPRKNETFNPEATKVVQRIYDETQKLLNDPSMDEHRKVVLGNLPKYVYRGSEEAEEKERAISSFSPSKKSAEAFGGHIVRRPFVASEVFAVVRGDPMGDPEIIMLPRGKSMSLSTARAESEKPLSSLPSIPTGAKWVKGSVGSVYYHEGKFYRVKKNSKGDSR